MSFRFANLGSGSSGNATLVEAALDGVTQRVLIDCGLAVKHLEQRLQALSLRLTDVDVVFVTHEHSDHWGCVLQLALDHGRSVWMSRGTWQAMGAPDMQGQCQFAVDQQIINLGVLSLHPFTVPHDAKEPLQLTLQSRDRRLGVLTDLGHASKHVLHQLEGVHALFMEFNHCPDLLQRSSYPPFLKRRIAGDHGHLSNQQAVDLLGTLMAANPSLNCVVAAHLSQQNNNEALVQQLLTTRGTMQWSIAKAQGDPVWFEVINPTE